MSEIDTRIENMEAELAALKAAREAEKAPFRIQGPVYVGQVFKARAGHFVTVTDVLADNRTFTATGTIFGWSAGEGKYWNYKLDGKLAGLFDGYPEDHIVSQAIGIRPEVGKVYETKAGDRVVCVAQDGDADEGFLPFACVLVGVGGDVDAYWYDKYGRRSGDDEDGNNLLKPIGQIQYS